LEGVRVRAYSPAVAARRFLVAGAGISGLACAFDLARAGAEVSVLDPADRAGGVVGTDEREGFLFETGPTTIQAGSESFRRLCADLGLAERLIASSPESDERYLFVDGRLRPLPSGPLSFLLSDVLSVRGRLRVCAEAFRRWSPERHGAEEPDLDAFFTERLGKEAARVLAGSFVRGVYAAELGELGARSAFPRMWNACEEHGGLVRGLRASSRRPRPALPGPDAPSSALLSFPRGLREIVEALSSALGERVRTGCALASLERTPSAWVGRTSDGRRIEADGVVLAVPAGVAARILAPFAERIPVDHLSRVRHADVTLVHLGFPASEVRRLPPGFGYLVPPGAVSEGVPRALGTIFTSNLFPGRAPGGCAAVSSFYRSAELSEKDEAAIVQLACEDLARATGELRIPRAQVTAIRAWRDVIPRYAQGHAARMAELGRAIADRLPGLKLAGSYVAGVSVDQVIASGRAAAAGLLG
jgi:oxygen-dependent protoporphyrinogen oxidase